MTKRIVPVLLLLLLSVAVNAQVSVKLIAKPVKCTYEKTAHEIDYYSCADGISRSYKRDDLLKEPNPHKSLFGCNMSQNDKYYIFNEQKDLWKNSQKCAELKNIYEKREKTEVLQHSASKLGEQLGYFLLDCQQQYVEKANDYVINGGLEPTWSNIGLKPISYTIEEFKASGLPMSGVWKYYKECENCVVCKEPENGYGVSLVLNKDIKESDCKKGFSVTRYLNDKFEDWKPHEVFPSKEKNVCSEIIDDGLRVYKGTNKEESSGLKKFNCNETNSVLLDSTDNLMEVTCLKFETQKTSTMQIRCSDLGTYWDKFTQKYKSTFDFKIKGCDGKVSLITHPCSGVNENEKWIGVPVGGQCPVYIELPQNHIRPSIKIDEWEREPGPTANIQVDSINWSVYKNDEPMKRKVMKIMYQHIGCIRNVYMDHFSGEKGKIEIQFYMDNDDRKMTAIRWNDRIPGPFHNYYVLDSALEKCFSSANASLSGRDGGGRIIVPIKVEPFGKQEDYSTIDNSTKVSQAKAKQICLSTDANKPRQASDIMSVVNALLPSVKSLYDEHQRTYHANHNCEFGGKVTVGLNIATSGKVSNATIKSSTTGYEEFDSALKKSIENTWNFCAASEENTVTVPLTLEPENPSSKCQVGWLAKKAQPDIIKKDNASDLPKQSSNDEIAQRKERLKKRGQENLDDEQAKASAAAESAKQNDSDNSMSTTKLLRIGVFSAIAIGGAAAAYMFDKKAKDATATPPTNEAEFKKGHDDAKQNQNVRNISLGVAAAGLVALGLTFLF